MAGSPDGTWDVVIAGASFAGLAAARALAGPSAGDPPAPAGASAPAWPSAAAGRPGGAQRAPRVLLLDARPIGEGVTSACAAPVRVVRLMGAEAAIAQVHDELVVHTPDGAVRWPLPEPFCTFDYRTFCRQAAQGCEAMFRLARVRGRQGRRVLTSAGAIEARFMVDATGPAAALAGRRPPPAGRGGGGWGPPRGGAGGGRGRPRYVAFGIESEVPAAVEAGLHFHFLPDLRDGYAWAFPAGDRTRFGVLSYRGRTKLLPVLRGFMARFGLAPGDLHGGYLATGWTAGVADGVFVAGDAAGHCLPLSGEGIRTAVLAGLRCGTLLRQVLDGRLAEARAQDAYRAYLAAARRRYRALLLGNLLLLGLPRRALGPAVRWLARPSVQRWFFAHYMRILDGARPVGRAPARA